MFEYIKQDFSNNNAFKSKFILGWFRLCQLVLAIKFKPVRWLLLPLVGGYRIFVDWFMGIDLHPALNLGAGATLYHGHGLVVAKGSVIGRNCLLRQGVTIGRKINADGEKSADPIIGDNVEFGANAMVIGGITIGGECVVGAGVVVTKSLQSGTVIVCQAPRILRGGYDGG